MPTQKESKHEKFIRVAEARADKILDMIRLLGNCSNTNNYEYTQQEVNYLFSRIRDELNAAEEKYKSKEKSKKVSFKFGDSEQKHVKK